MQAQLEFADENGYTDVANYVALYEKTDATAEELESAADELQQAVTDRLGTGASEEQPKFTDLLANPSFDADNSGWIEDGGSPTLDTRRMTNIRTRTMNLWSWSSFVRSGQNLEGPVPYIFIRSSKHALRPLPFVGSDSGYNQSNLNDIPPEGYISLPMRRNMTRSSELRRIR